MDENIIDLNVFRKSKNGSPSFDLDAMDSEDFVFVINSNDNYEKMKFSIGELWNELYCRKKPFNMFADDDGFIYYSSKYVNPVELESTYDKSSYLTLKIFIDFLNNKQLADSFMEFYEVQAKEKDIIMLITRKEKAPIPDQEN